MERQARRPGLDACLHLEVDVRLLGVPAVAALPELAASEHEVSDRDRD